MSFDQNEDVLNAALDELDDGSDDEDDSSHDEYDVEEDQQEVKGKQDTADVYGCTSTINTNTRIHKPTFGPVPPPPTSPPRNEEEEMLKVMGELESFLKDESNGAQSKTKGDKKGRPSNKSSSSGESSNGSATGTTGANDKSSFTTELDSAISNLLGEIGKSPELPNNLEGMESDMANDFFKEFEKSMRMPSAATSTGKEGDSEDGEIMGDVVNGMMKQLLGKELMYEPMKGICDRFPQWLAENKSKLGDEEYQRYGNQYQYFQRIVAVYENDEDNTDRLAELMHDIQEFGQPPHDLVQQMAPGLEFDEEGMPKMDGNDSGLPFPMGNEECSIM